MRPHGSETALLFPDPCRCVLHAGMARQSRREEKLGGSQCSRRAGLGSLRAFPQERRRGPVPSPELLSDITCWFQAWSQRLPWTAFSGGRSLAPVREKGVLVGSEQGLKPRRWDDEDWHQLRAHSQGEDGDRCQEHT